MSNGTSYFVGGVCYAKMRYGNHFIPFIKYSWNQFQQMQGPAPDAAVTGMVFPENVSKVACGDSHSM